MHTGPRACRGSYYVYKEARKMPTLNWLLRTWIWRGEENSLESCTHTVVCKQAHTHNPTFAPIPVRSVIADWRSLLEYGARFVETHKSCATRSCKNSTTQATNVAARPSTKAMYDSVDNSAHSGPCVRAISVAFGEHAAAFCCNRSDDRG